MTTRRIHGAGGSLAARPTAKRQPAPATPPRLGVAWACANSRKQPYRTWSASPRPTAKRTIGDTEGTSAIVSVAWVDFRTTHDMTAFKSVMDRQGSGDIRPLAALLLGLADIRFTGLNDDSEPNGSPSP